MKNSFKILVLGATFLSAACVTTRAQLNEKNGVLEDSEAPSEVSDETPSRPNKSVKSENLTPDAPVAVSTPLLNSTPKEVAPAEVKVPPLPVLAVPSPSPSSSTATSMPPHAATATAQEVPTAPAGSPAATAPVLASPPPLSAISLSAVAANGGEYSDDELKIELARVSNEVETLQHDKQLTEEQHQAQEKKYLERIAELEKQLKVNTGPVAPALPEGKSPFEAGKDAYLSGHHEDAVSFMDQYLKAENPKSADEAVYIRAQANFKQKNYKQAIVDFSKFPEKYQKSPFHPKALLGIAQSFEEMSMRDDAKAFYSELAEKFPKTAEGKLAKKKLKKK